MDKLLHSRLFRCLVCLVLVCCILVNVSPLKAESTGIEVAVGISGVAVLAWAALSAAGVVFVPETVQQANALADSLQDFAERTFTTDEEWEEYKNYVDNFNNNFFNEPDAPDPGNRGLLAKVVGTAMGTALAGFAYGVIKDQEQVEVEEEVTADDGFLYYDDVSFPSFPDTYVEQYPCMYIMSNSYSNSYKLYFIDASLYYDEDDECYYKSGQQTINGVCYSLNSGGTAWVSPKPGNYTCFTTTYGDFLWSNCDLELSDGTFLLGTEPSITSTITVPVLPDTYVGDIPDQVKNGTLTAESLPLPDTFDLSSIVTSPSTAMQELTQTAQQLASGSTTYNDYITNITYVDDPEPETTEPTEPLPGTGGGSGNTGGSDSGDGSGDDSGEQERPPITDILPYGLDLTDYFPFCIPFDLYDFFTCLDAAPRAPKFHWEIQDLSGGSYAIDIDLSPWDEVAALFRHLQLLLFVVGLAAATRKYIKW